MSAALNSKRTTIVSPGVSGYGAPISSCRVHAAGAILQWPQIEQLYDFHVQPHFGNPTELALAQSAESYGYPVSLLSQDIVDTYPALPAATEYQAATPLLYELSQVYVSQPIQQQVPIISPQPLYPSQIAALAPPLGFQSGVNPTGTGDCDGAVNGADGKPIKVPCACPPSQDVYIQALTANVQAGKAINNPSVGVQFPTDDSKQSQATRIQAALVTIQNLNGEGKGCPAASTTLSAQLKAAQS
ncbi:hypothetical protein EVG20_g6333 [Dentipellis fragilis]|uniref:Uncharacterized protein n=1 Tax=Dentipellis fragilis TaxID=205917 RepID=A0A4Y9YLF0_9AGAM|nr:hypothetical protein EVG20_g6333 [Dentipellis fragilis]